MAEDSVWEKKRKAQEDQHFEEESRRALERLLAKKKGRLSPISGQPLQELEYKGVKMARCAQSGGIWLDKEELAKMIRTLEQEGLEPPAKAWLAGLLAWMPGKTSA